MKSDSMNILSDFFCGFTYKKSLFHVYHFLSVITPDSYRVQTIFSFISQILGFGWETIKTKFGMAAGIDSEKMSQIETAISKGEEGMDQVKKVKEEGLAGAVDIAKDQVEEAKATAMSSISDWAIMAIVKAAVPRVIAMLNPAGAIAQLIVAMVKAIIWFKDNFQRIAKWVKTVFDSVVDIAGGAIGAAAQKVEQSMAQAIPMILGFLAEQLGLGGIGKAISDVMEKIRKPVDKIVDKIVNWIVTKAKKLIERVKKMFGKDKKPEDGNDQNPHRNSANTNDHEVGADIPFTVNGEQHHLWVDTNGRGAEVMVASDPRPVREMLPRWRTSANKKYNSNSNKDPEKYNEAMTLIEDAQSKYNEVQRKATIAESLMSKKDKNENEQKEANKADNELEIAERELKNVISKIYLHFGEKEEQELKVGLHGTLFSTGRESHHVPAKELANTLGKLYGSISEKIPKDDITFKSLKKQLDERKKRIDQDPDGKKLSAILLHRGTHRTALNAVHGIKLQKDVLPLIEAEVNNDENTVVRPIVLVVDKERRMNANLWSEHWQSVLKVMYNLANKNEVVDVKESTPNGLLIEIKGGDKEGNNKIANHIETIIKKETEEDQNSKLNKDIENEKNRQNVVNLINNTGILTFNAALQNGLKVG